MMKMFIPIMLVLFLVTQCPPLLEAKYLKAPLSRQSRHLVNVNEGYYPETIEEDTVEDYPSPQTITMNRDERDLKTSAQKSTSMTHRHHPAPTRLQNKPVGRVTPMQDSYANSYTTVRRNEVITRDDNVHRYPGEKQFVLITGLETRRLGDGLYE